MSTAVATGVNDAILDIQVRGDGGSTPDGANERGTAIDMWRAPRPLAITETPRSIAAGE